MMKSIFSDQYSALEYIYSDEVELVSINRPNFSDVEELSLKFIKSKQPLKLRWVQDLDDKNSIKNVLPESIESSFRSVLMFQIDESIKILNSLMGCKKVRIRLETLRSPMCPLFHVDNIQFRLLMTLCGKGTEWIPNNLVDWEILSDINNDNNPVSADSEIQEFQVGNLSLLKGGAWNNHFNGVVHRSPLSDEDRLLLSLDPIFE